MRKYILWAVLPLFIACQSTVSDTSQTVNFFLTGDMLFEGPNSLQGEGGMSLENLAENIGIPMEDILSVSITDAKIGLEEGAQSITESLTLQLVSDANELKTMGTLSPVEAVGILGLSLAEETNLLPYMRDNGMTWVLDLNLREDHMDLMKAKGQITLKVDYKESK